MPPWDSRVELNLCMMLAFEKVSLLPTPFSEGDLQIRGAAEWGVGAPRVFHMSLGPQQSPLTLLSPHSLLADTTTTWKGNWLLKERQPDPSCCSADRCVGRRRQLVPIWRTDAGMGKVSHQTVFRFHSILSPTLHNAAAAAGPCPLLCSLSPIALVGKEAERRDRRWSHLLLPAA